MFFFDKKLDILNFCDIFHLVLLWMLSEGEFAVIARRKKMQNLLSTQYNVKKQSFVLMYRTRFLWLITTTFAGQKLCRFC